MEIEKIKDYFKRAQEEKNEIKSIYNEVLELTDSFYQITDESKTKLSSQRNVDGDVLDSIENLCSFIMSSVFSRTDNWASIEVNKLAMQEQFGEQAQKHIDEINKVIDKDIDTTFLHIQNSNYYVEIVKAMKNFIKLGTGAFVLKETGIVSKPFKFEYVGIDNLFILEDSFSEPSIVFKKHPQITVEYLKDIFGPSVKLPDSINENDFTTKFDVFECQIPIFDETTGRTVYEYLVMDSKLDSILLEKELIYKALIVARWDNVEGSSWGKSIVVDMKSTLSDIKGYKELYKLQARKIANPPTAFAGNIELFYSLNLDEGMMNYVGDPSQGQAPPMIQTVGNNANLMPLNLDIQEERARFKRALMADVISMNAQDGKYISATQAQIAHQLFRERFANTYELINRELLEPVFLGPFTILLSNNQLNLTTEILPYTSIIYKNELSKASNSSKVQKILSYAQIANELQQHNSQGVVIDMTKTLPYVSQNLEIPTELVPSESQLKEIQDAQIQMMQQQQQGVQ